MGDTGWSQLFQLHMLPTLRSYLHFEVISWSYLENTVEWREWLDQKKWGIYVVSKALSPQSFSTEHFLVHTIWSLLSSCISICVRSLDPLLFLLNCVLWFARKLEGHTYTKACFICESNIVLKMLNNRVENWVFPNSCQRLSSAKPSWAFSGLCLLSYWDDEDLGPTSWILGYGSLWQKVSLELSRDALMGRMPSLL